MMGRSQRFAILEWGLVNPEKISEFLQRMKVDQRCRTYYYGLYASLRLLYRRQYDETPVTVVQAKKHWSSKLDHVLDEEHEELEHCEVEAASRRSKVSWLQEVKTDNLQN